jgi:hypothetical protein
MSSIELLPIFINGEKYIYTRSGWKHCKKESKPMTLRDVVLMSAKNPGIKVGLSKPNSETDKEARLIFPIISGQWLSFIDHQVYWPALVHVYNNKVEIEFTVAPFNIDWMTPNIDLNLCDLPDQELWTQHGSFAIGGTLVT